MAQTFASCFHDPDPAADWEVWYRDTFDRECPPQVDVQGQGLAHGLMELWARYLFEEIGVGGRGGFSSFHFRWRNNRINIAGSWQGATRLREWVFGTQEHSSKGYIQEGDAELLRRIACTHAHGIQTDPFARAILTAADSAADRERFEAELLVLVSK
jgi:hypothetical protein